MRNLYGTAHCSTASAPIQVGSLVRGDQVVFANLKARASNGANIYLGNSSAMTSTSAWELTNGASLNEDYGMGAVAGNRFWMVSTSTAAQLDWAFGVSD